MFHRHHAFKFIVVTLVAVLALAACSTPQMAGSPATGEQVTGDQGGSNAPGAQATPATGDQPGGLITASGTPAADSAVASGGEVQSGSSGGASGASAPDSNPGDATPHFEIYRSDLCHFEIGYPSGTPVDYVPQEGAVTSQGTTTICRVAFQDRVLAQSDTAALQPPLFLVEVYARPAGSQSLEDWVRAQPLPGKANASFKAATVGGKDGLQVTLMQEMAPNRFFFAAHGDLFYKLTPLGPYGDAMLASFRLID